MARAYHQQDDGADFAQGGGPDASGIDAALAAAKAMVS